MGTKGKKNIPITARVESGLFNQKKGVKEPLLNVGPAGVHGNNQTRDIPSPSKLRGYSMKKKTESPLKQQLAENKPIQAVITTQGAGEMIVEKGKEKTKRTYKKPTRTPEGDAAYAKLTPAQRKAQDDRYRSRKKNQIDTPTGEFEPDTKKFVPGKKEIKLEDLEAEGKRGISQGWEVNQQARKQRKLSGNIEKGQKNIDKYSGRLSELGTQGKDGTWTMKAGADSKKYKKNLRRFNEATRNRKASQDQFDTYSKGVSRGASGYRGDTFGVTEKATILDVGNIDQQVAFLTGGNEGTNNNSTTNPLIEDVKSTGNKKSSRFFKTKSPMKKNYFK
jgi:hypothetical protein